MLAALHAACLSYTVAVVGAHGGLGRELVQQARDRQWEPVALVRRNDPLYYPVRRGGLSPAESSSNLNIVGVETCLTKGANSTVRAGVDAVVFAIGGKPFADDDTTEVVRGICDALPDSCRNVCLVSAYGVGESIEGANIGIQAMRAWYLKSVYAAKEIQENIVRGLPDTVRTRVIRPRALSYGRMRFNVITQSREDLAREILEWCANQ